MRHLLLATVVALVHVTPAAAREYKVATTYRGTPGVESFGYSIAADDQRVLIGAPFERVNGTQPGVAYYFEGGVLVHQLVPPVSGGSFGLAVAMTDVFLIVGSPTEAESGQQRGAVRVYDAATGALVRTFPNPSLTFENAGFGRAITVVGSDLLIGGSYGLTATPPVDVVYRYDLATGALVQTYRDPAGPGGHGFGASIAGVGQHVVIGSPGYRTSVFENPFGRAYTFDGASGDAEQTIENPEPAVTTEFGRSLAAVGSAVLIGAPNRGAAGDGAAHLVDPLTGNVVRSFRRTFPGSPDAFGIALTAVGADLLIGSPTNYGYDGDSSLIFLFDAATGTADGVISLPGVDEFGSALAATGRDLLVYGDEADASGGSGAVFRLVPACGDGVLDGCERCDDGNQVAGDGCDADCRLESCGNGVREAGEECDDGNAIAGDGCDPDCSTSRCGNCLVAPDEGCDDGNATIGDGCDPGCTPTACGNGIVSVTEQCDDGNAVEGDGCSNTCRIEVCGNFGIDAGESCDGDTEYPEECVDCRRVAPDLAAWKPVFDFSLGQLDPLLGKSALAITDQYLVAVLRPEVFDDTGPLPIVPVARVSDRETGVEVHRFDGLAARTLAAFGNDILIGEIEPIGRVQLFDGATFEPRRSFEDPTPTTGPFGLSLHGVGDRVLVQDAGDAAVYAFDSTTGALAYRLDEPAPAGDPAAFGAVILGLGPLLLVSGESAGHVFERASGAFIRTLAAPGGVALVATQAVALETEVLVPDALGNVHLFDPATGAVLYTFARPTLASEDDHPPAVVVTDRDVAIGGFGVVRVFDRPTRVLRHTIQPLVPTPRGCFGATIAAFDAGLVVGDPCLSNGPIAVFDHANGAPLSVLRDFFYDRLNGPLAAYGTTFLATLEFGDFEQLTAYRPCSDGVLRPGEECDDANLTSGDGCDVNCTDTRCGNGVVTTGEACDPYALPTVEQCSADCQFGACPDALTLEGARLSIRRARPPAGDETLVFSGRLVTASGAPVVASPARTGAQLLIERADGTALIALTTPSFPIGPGPRGSGCGPRDGWRTDAHRDIYVNHSDAVGICTPGSAHGLRRWTLTHRARGDAEVRIRLAPTTMASVESPIRVRLGLDYAPLTQFPGPCHGSAAAELECRPNLTGATFDCR